MKKLSLAFAAILAASCATAASAAMFTDFESYKSFEAGGNPVYAFDDAADVWVGEWSGGGTTADTVTAEIAEGAGYNGSKALKVQSSGHENVGLYLFATADNGIVTDHTGAQYLRVWADFSEVDFRKANFGTTDSTYSLFSTDEVDTNWECKYYFSADGANWEEYVHGDDGCFGTGQAGTVLGMKGWFAFPVADFTIRGNANWEAYDELTPANPADVSGVYLFWDYDDATAADTPFYLDNLEFVADYKVFDYDAAAGAAAAPAAPAAEAAPAAGLPAAYPASGTAIPDGSVLIAGELIGSENGWDGTAASGRASAFDGNIETFFDPATASVDYCGIDAGEEMILTKIIIHPRTTFLDRFNGATIEASNDPEFEESVELFFSVEQAAEIAFVDCTSEMEESENTGYRYFRYINYMNHGDVAEVELYGKAKDGSNPVYGAAAAPAAPAATEAPAAEAAATETIAIEAVAQDYPSMDLVANNGASYATLEEAAASLGKTPITGYTFISGTAGNGNEGPEMLWDNDTTTKFCTSTFPTITIAAADGEYAIDGIIMATANDNSSYNNRSPYEWAVYGSNDGTTWTALAYGDDYFFEEVDFTYFAAPLTTEGSYKYFQFQSEGALSGCFQVSELVLTGTKVAAAEAPVAEAPAAEAAPAGETFDYAHFVASANDPYFGYDNTIDIDPEVVTWAQIKYRTITEKDSLDNTLTGQIYVSPAAEPFIPVKWNHTGNWETIVVDLTSVSEKTTLTSLWKDSLGLGFRLDPMESNRDAEANTGDDPAAVLPDSAIDVAYVAFFETEEAAKAFDGVNGAVALVDAAMLAAPSASTNGAVELLTETVAAPVVEEAPAVEEPAEEAPVEEPAEEVPAEEEVVEEPAEEVVEEVVEEAPVEEAPETFDFAVIAAIAAAVSAAGYAISKKR